MATVLALAMVVMAVTVLATDMERGLPTLRLMPGTDTEDSTATVSALAMAVTVMVASTDTERGQLRPSPRLMPGTDTEDSTDTVLALAMAAMVVTVLATDMERGLPTLRLMPGMVMVASTAMDLV